MAKKRKGYICPPSIPAEVVCRTILIPATPLVLAAVNGALDQLRYFSSWESVDGEVLPGEMAARCRTMVADFLVSGCAQGEYLELQIIDCILYYRLDPLDPWILLGNTCGAAGADGADGADGAQGPPGEQGIQGEQGDQGIQGIQGVQGVQGIQGDIGPAGPPGADCECPEGPEYPYPGDDQPHADAWNEENICAGVMQLVVYLTDLQDSILDEIDAGLNEAKAISAIAIAIAELASGGFLELMPVDEFAEIYFDMAQGDIDSRRVESSSLPNQEAWQEYLYCAIKDTPEQDFTEAIFEDWITNSIEPLEAELFPLNVGKLSAMIRDAYGYTSTKARYIMYSYDKENDCRLLGWCPDDDPPPVRDLDLQHYVQASGDNSWQPPPVLPNGWTYPLTPAHGVWNDDDHEVIDWPWWNDTQNGQTGNKCGFIIDFGDQIRLWELWLSLKEASDANPTAVAFFVGCFGHDGVDANDPWTRITGAGMGAPTLPIVDARFTGFLPNTWTRFVFVSVVWKVAGLDNPTDLVLHDLKAHITNPCDATFYWYSGNPCP